MTYELENGDLTLTLTGDAMLTRGLKPFREPGFLGVRELLTSADIGFTNGEMLFHNYENWPAAYSQTWMRCDPRFLEDLKWFGVNLLSCANNHATDYGEGGVVTNIESLDAANLAHAGSGRNYADALAPAYLDTANGRVALVAGATSARSRAGEQRRDMKGRPGVNLLRWVNEWTVDDAAFAQLQRVAEQFHWPERLPAWWKKAYGFTEDQPDDVVYLSDRNLHGIGGEDPVARFVRGESFAHASRIHEGDFARNIESVAEAKQMADWVVYSIHSHEGGATNSEPASHTRDLAYAVIDAGADVVIGHGPHRDRGVEIYKGKPILYSLGTFFMQNDTVERLPQDALALYGLGQDANTSQLYQARSKSKGTPASPTASLGPHGQSAIARVTFENRNLTGLVLHPIEFGYGMARSQAGRPVLADGQIADEVLDRFEKMSEPFGTKIERRGNEGHILI